MGVEIDIKTNPLDVIPPGVVFVFPEGQTVIKSPIVVKNGGVLVVEDNGTLILED